ncbi:hypothetical protein, partial [Nocardia flavorosea]|uniref:hypothetical protein n=1 Tax=Nocardia flavorosea TaxID=53429 RepID=UPI00245703A6
MDGAPPPSPAPDPGNIEENDALIADVLDADPRGETKQFLTQPVGGETSGPLITEERVIVCV